MVHELIVSRDILDSCYAVNNTWHCEDLQDGVYSLFLVSPSVCGIIEDDDYHLSVEQMMQDIAGTLAYLVMVGCLDSELL